MSDFDKEAEREKLREKYEQDEERRKTTEQMSELLLKGATMTNAHCSDCGDPIFRYDGQEFCPTCQKPVDRGDGGGSAAEESADDGPVETADSGEAQHGGARSDNIEVTSPSDDATVQFGGSDANEPAESAAEQSAADQARDALAEQSADAPAQSAGQGGAADENVQQVPSAEPSDSSTAGQSPTQPGSQSVDVDPTESAGTPASDSVGQHLGRAQRVLAQTVERHANLAAAAETPRQTREHLETAREAAETLAALDF